jgi:hypothetical protein
MDIVDLFTSVHILCVHFCLLVGWGTGFVPTSNPVPLSLASGDIKAIEEVESKAFFDIIGDRKSDIFSRNRFHE